MRPPRGGHVMTCNMLLQASATCYEMSQHVAAGINDSGGPCSEKSGVQGQIYKSRNPAHEMTYNWTI